MKDYSLSPTSEKWKKSKYKSSFFLWFLCHIFNPLSALVLCCFTSGSSVNDMRKFSPSPLGENYSAFSIANSYNYGEGQLKNHSWTIPLNTFMGFHYIERRQTNLATSSNIKSQVHTFQLFLYK